MELLEGCHIGLFFLASCLSPEILVLLDECTTPEGYNAGTDSGRIDEVLGRVKWHSVLTIEH